MLVEKPKRRRSNLLNPTSTVKFNFYHTLWSSWVAWCTSWRRGERWSDPMLLLLLEHLLLIHLELLTSRGRRRKLLLGTLLLGMHLPLLTTS